MDACSTQSAPLLRHGPPPRPAASALYVPATRVGATTTPPDHTPAPTPRPPGPGINQEKKQIETHTGAGRQGRPLTSPPPQRRRWRCVCWRYVCVATADRRARAPPPLRCGWKACVGVSPPPVTAGTGTSGRPDILLSPTHPWQGGGSLPGAARPRDGAARYYPPPQARLAGDPPHPPAHTTRNGGRLGGGQGQEEGAEGQDGGLRRPGAWEAGPLVGHTTPLCTTGAAHRPVRRRDGSGSEEAEGGKKGGRNGAGTGKGAAASQERVADERKSRREWWVGRKGMAWHVNAWPTAQPPMYSASVARERLWGGRVTDCFWMNGGEGAGGHAASPALGRWTTRAVLSVCCSSSKRHNTHPRRWSDVGVREKTLRPLRAGRLGLPRGAEFMGTGCPHSR